MRVDVITLFPEMFEGPMTESMMWKARSQGYLDLHLHQLRDFATSKHRTTDDTPYGGGGGMILKPDVLVPAIASTLQDTPANTPVIMMSPQGRVFNHSIAVELAQHDQLIFVCGRYEGVDERVRDLVITDEISIGDYVLTGGELPTMVVIDAVMRQLPGLLGAEGAADQDSHADGLLEGPHYTKPATYRGLGVPDVLAGGDHGAVAAWRRKEALRRTWQNRPDLLLHAELSEADRYALAEIVEDDINSR